MKWVGRGIDEKSIQNFSRREEMVWKAYVCIDHDIRMGLREIGSKYVDCQYRTQCWSFVNTVLNDWIS
jgi:hypothetical protein